MTLGAKQTQKYIQTNRKGCDERLQCMMGVYLFIYLFSTVTVQGNDA